MVFHLIAIDTFPFINDSRNSAGVIYYLNDDTLFLLFP